MRWVLGTAGLGRGKGNRGEAIRSYLAQLSPLVGDGDGKDTTQSR